MDGNPSLDLCTYLSILLLMDVEKTMGGVDRGLIAWKEGTDRGLLKVMK